MALAPFATRLIEWADVHGRHGLPWQNTHDPYRIWLSEVMLQQTQVATVLDYYARFLQRYPTVADLAAASVDDVLALWSGLGYYSRARNLHRCAQAIVESHGGRFPGDAATLATLPGIGRSTAAAIASLAYGERVAILDGNVKRVLTRWLGFGDDLARPAHERALWQRATELLPSQRVDRYTQAVMDLGASLCAARSPRCLLCPVNADCVARREGAPERYPVKTRTLRRTQRETVWLWLERGDEVWLVQRPSQGVWGGLWSLPEFASDEALVAAGAAHAWGGEPEALPTVAHALTHFDWRLHPRRWRLPLADGLGLPLGDAAGAGNIGTPGNAARWFGYDEALALGLPAPLRKLFVAHHALAA